jgi:hypothetical protein
VKSFLRAFAVVGTAALVLGAPSPVSASPLGDPSSDAQTIGDEIVHFRNDSGGLETAADVPGGSAFSRGGGGGGGTPTPCGTYGYFAEFTDPLHPNYGKPIPAITNADGSVVPDPKFTADATVDLPSTRWEFDEVTDVTPVENEAQLRDFLYRDYDPEGWRRYVDNTQPLDSLMRRFAMNCLYSSGTNGAIWWRDYLGVTDVSILDPFFGVDDTAAALRAGIQIDPITINTIPDESVWGGLVVNAPTHLSVDSDVWRIYNSSDRTRGLTLTQTVSPRSLDFNIQFTPEGGSTREMIVNDIGCLNNVSTDRAASGQIPKLPRDFPEFAVEDPGLPCAWLPTEPGTVTIRAMIVYDVTIHLNSYTRREAPYLWVSNPTTLRVDELIAVNVNDN